MLKFFKKSVPATYSMEMLCKYQIKVSDVGFQSKNILYWGENFFCVFLQ